MAIHQIQIRHDEAEDRLLLRMSTTDNCEVRFWLTRRFTRLLWTALVKMLEWDRAVKQQIDPQTRRAVLDIQHEGYSQHADFSKKFEEPKEAPRQLLLGETPVLLAKVQGRKQGDGVHVLSLHPLQGQGIDITLDTKLLHLFMKLMREQVAKTDWDLNLDLYGAGDSAAPDAEPRARQLN
jgi:hypothetical protein